MTASRQGCRRHLLLLAALCVTLHTAKASPAPQVEPPRSHLRNFTGIGVGALVGFGSGYMIQERMHDRGWMTVLQFGSLLATVATLPFCSKGMGSIFLFGPLFTDDSKAKPPDEAGQASQACTATTFASAAFISLRMFEILDLLSFLKPVDRRSTTTNTTTNTATKKVQGARISLYPTLLSQDLRTGVSAGLELKAQF